MNTSNCANTLAAKCDLKHLRKWYISLDQTKKKDQTASGVEISTR